MVIYDTKNNNNGQVKGRLHLSAMDIDYLVSKYGVEGLIDLIPTDYVECFKFELDKRKKESKLSVQYYASLSLGIETTFDERGEMVLMSFDSIGRMEWGISAVTPIDANMELMPVAALVVSLVVISTLITVGMATMVRSMRRKVSIGGP